MRGSGVAARPIRRLLVANRGEIAVRIARTAHRLGIDTVGIYSEPDVGAVHVAAMDRAVALGGTTPAESYLRIDAIVAAARATSADAVHPGYGFLAERADAARAVTDAGLVWVGPTADQIALLGDKVAAKRAAVEAGVPTSTAVEVDSDHVDSVTASLALPVLVKAVAGGGGRGMRIVRDWPDLADAVASAAREAEAAFGDGTVFVEPFVDGGRHVEVQIVGDAHGSVIHLGERECSIQRRNQKVIEEAPSAGITVAVRARLYDAAVSLARHVGYENAGTVEFLVGPDGAIHLLEVNTRLQVEHPVTEAVTGLDLVELQLRVAAGEPLGLGQDEVTFSGHAVEARVVAEDPAAGWLPSVGRIERFSVGPEVRTDSGVSAGSEVTAEYDSLLAKVIAWAPTRTQAARVLSRALRTASIDGVRTNRDMLVATLGHDAFQAADTTTSFLDAHPELAAAGGPAGDDRLAHLAAAVLEAEATDREADGLWGFAPSGWRNVRTAGQLSAWTDVGSGERVDVESVAAADGVRFTLLVGEGPRVGDDGALTVDTRRSVAVRRVARRPSGSESTANRHRTGEVGVEGGLSRTLALEVDGTRLDITVHADRAGRVVTSPVVTRSSAGQVAWAPVPRFAAVDEGLASGGPVAPLPGRVLSVDVAAGDRVAAGATLVVLEAMKMEHRITAPAEAVVTEVRVAADDRVEAGDVLVLLEAPMES